MCAHSTLVLLICEARRRLRLSLSLSLSVTVVVARHLRLRWWGVAVISSRGPGLVRIGLAPLVHDGSDVAEEVAGGIVREVPGARQGCCLRSYLGSTSVAPLMG